MFAKKTGNAFYLTFGLLSLLISIPVQSRSHELTTQLYDPQCREYDEYRHGSDASWQASFGTTTLFHVPCKQSTYWALQGAVTVPVERTVLLPQEPYLSKHRPKRFRPSGPLQFRTKGNGYISLHDASVGAFYGLERCNEPVYMGPNPRKTLRLQVSH